MTPEELYWLKMTYEKKEQPKPFDVKAYAKKYYQEHKGYVNSKTQYHRKKKKDEVISNVSTADSSGTIAD